MCPTGHYCPAGSASPTSCPPGTYGATQGLSTSACSGQCSLGYFCLLGSTSATSQPCPKGFYGSTPGQSTSTCSGPCPAGRFGATVAEINSTCSGTCLVCCVCCASVLNACAFACSLASGAPRAASTTPARARVTLVSTALAPPPHRPNSAAATARSRTAAPTAALSVPRASGAAWARAVATCAQPTA